MIDGERARRFSIIGALGTSQTLAWASSYYLLAILADPIAAELGTSTTNVFAAFSASLLLSALVGPRVGLTIDRLGGREVLAASNVLFAAALAILAVAHSGWVMWIAWLVMGVAMGLGLYDAAFATLGRLYGENARGAITGITLFAGFASTIGWPLTAWGEAELGWRYTCLAWAVAHLLIGLPLNLFVLPRIAPAVAAESEGETPRIAMDRAMLLLSFAFAAGWLVSTAMAAHLPRLLESAGATTAQAVAAAALVGPAQVAARVLEASLLGRYHPLVSARISAVAHPIGAGLLFAGGALLAIPFTILHGAGNGILTIARGTVPLAVFGPENYGYRLGIMGAPARICQAAAPVGFGLLLEAFGQYALVFSTLLCLAALGAFMAVGNDNSAALLRERAAPRS